MNRRRLPDRLPINIVELVHDGQAYAVSIGIDPRDGWVGEVHARGAKTGSALDAILDDACVALSLLLQHGIGPSALASSMGRLNDGTTPASIIGALADLLTREARS